MEVTYEKYDREIKDAHMEIGALKERLRLANLKIEEKVGAIEGMDNRLAIAESLLSNDGLEWCENCENYTCTGYETTIKSSIDGPEEGAYFCEDCGKIRENQ